MQRKSFISMIGGIVISLFLTTASVPASTYVPVPTYEESITETDSNAKKEIVLNIVEETETCEEELEETTADVEEEPEMRFSREDIELIALVTMAEAEGEPEKGKRLVIDTILNRVDSPYFPNTIREVIYQKGQFSSMWNGRVNRCYIDDDICDLVIQEYENRINYDVMFFTAGHYSKYGKPLFKEGNHYFSRY